MPSRPADHPEPNIRKIAVLRANALGDFIFALPALEALRATYPDAEIVLLARQWHHTFLVHRDSPIDRVVVIPEGGIGNESAQQQDPTELAIFFAAMQQEQFDLAIQLHGGGKNSNPFLLQLRARLTVGLRTPDAPALDRWIPYIYYQPEILRYLEVVALVGAKPITVVPKIQVMPCDRTAAEQWVTTLQQADKTPIVALHPGATDPRRRWPIENFAQVGDALTQAGATVVVTGTEPEQDLVQGVIEQMQTSAQNLCGQLSLNALTGLLAGCQVVISNDSGPLHLAAAVGTATVGIYWCGNVITAGLPTRSHHRLAIAWQLHCPVCGLDCTREPCDHRESFVADIPPEQVITAALDLLHS